MSIIDAHLHLVPRSPVFNEWAAKCGVDHSYDGLLREMDANGIERAVVIGHWVMEEGAREAPFTNRTNNDLIDFVERSGGRLRDCWESTSLRTVRSTSTSSTSISPGPTSLE